MKCTLGVVVDPLLQFSIHRQTIVTVTWGSALTDLLFWLVMNRLSAHSLGNTPDISWICCLDDKLSVTGGWAGDDLWLTLISACVGVRHLVVGCYLEMFVDPMNITRPLKRQINGYVVGLFLSSFVPSFLSFVSWCVHCWILYLTLRHVYEDWPRDV